MPRAAFLFVFGVLVAGGAGPTAPGALTPAEAADAQFFRDGYACYPGQFSGFKRPAPVQLIDLLSGRSRLVAIGSPATVCAPATSGSSPSRTKGYLVCYPTKSASLGLATRLTSRALGELRLSPSTRREFVCFESDRVDKRTSTRRSTDRVYVCYRASTSGTETRIVRATDAFGRTEANTAAVPNRGCAAAGQRAPPTLSPSYVVCSSVTSASPPGSVLLKNRFGYLKAALGPREAVCTEATR